MARSAWSWPAPSSPPTPPPPTTGCCACWSTGCAGDTAGTRRTGGKPRAHRRRPGQRPDPDPDPARPLATRIGVLNGRVVGLDDELDGVRADRRIDLGGAPVLPGFHDAHFHASITGARLAALDLRPDVVPTLDGLYAAVARRAATLGPGEWLMAAGYDQNALGAHPEADALDAVAGGRPVVLEHVSAHMLVANTAAFERAGYPERARVPDADGGRVVPGPDGRAAGLLQEKAM